MDDPRKKPKNLNFETVRSEERRAIMSARVRQGRKSDSDHCIALCLSGGGIRSATFSLGVLQGLAKKGLLDEFDYLSTVSGGGFIGSWLNAWLRHQNPVRPPWNELLLGAAGTEPEPVKHLRKYSNYLSPLLGFTNDFLLMIGTFLANLLLNWMVSIPLLFAVTLLPWLWLGIQTAARPLPTLWLLVGAIGLLIGAVILWHFARRRTAVAVLVSVIAAVVPHAMSLLPALKALDRSYMAILSVPVGLTAVWFVMNLIWVVRYRPRLNTGEAVPEDLRTLGAWLLAAAALWLLVSGIVLGIVPRWFETLTEVDRIKVLRTDAVRGLQESAIGTDESRDAMLRWDVAARIAASSSIVVQKLAHPASLGIVGLLLGGLTSLVGYRSRNGPAPGGDRKPGISGVIGRHLLVLSAALFVVLLFFVGSWVTTKLIGDWLNWFCTKPITAGTFEKVMRSPDDLWRVAVSVPCLFGVSMGFSWLIGVNSLSLHSFYRNRLKAAYVGAHKNDDDLALTTSGRRPLHIINATLNMTTPDAAQADWQERKAQPFTFSPLHVGNRDCGYAESSEYAGGIKLSQAMAISGAAASPNMGYHTSPLVSFVMAFFNVRLGVWLPNVNNDVGSYEPRHALLLHLQEFFGQSTADLPWFYLSDGGHFDNLGLYEMVRRRCRRIVVVDAGCDPDYKFEDLGNAIRKIRIDERIEIKFPDPLPKPDSAGLAQDHFQVGTIEYPDNGSGIQDGTLLLVKPVLTGDEPHDLLAFASEHSRSGDRFPQQPTSDQFFSESQFESYRALGEHSVEAFASGVWPSPVRPRFIAPARPPLPQTFASIPFAGEEARHGRWWSGMSPLGSFGLAPFAATAAAATTATLILAPVLIQGLSGDAVNPPNPTPSSTAVIIAVPDRLPTDRVMLPFFEEARSCPTGQERNCNSLSFAKAEGRRATVSIAGSPTSLRHAARVAIVRMKDALSECKAESGSVTVVGHASSTELANASKDDSMSFNLALADDRADTVAKQLGNHGKVRSWTRQAQESGLLKAYADMRIAAMYNDRPSGSPASADVRAANLTRRVDLIFDVGRLGECTPTFLIYRAAGTHP